MRSLDHFVVLVRDLASVPAVWQRLGFKVMPRMHHAALGTSNHVIQFHGTYLELLGDAEKCLQPALARSLATRLAGGEGFYINSLTTNDLVGDRERLVAAGHDCNPILSARRQVVMPDGRTDETASDVVYVWRQAPRAAGTLFYSCHSKPHVIWFEPWQTHPNTVQRALSLTYRSDDLAADEPYVTDLMAAPPTLSEPDALIWRSPRGERFEWLSPKRIAARFGHHAAQLSDLPAVGVALRLGVASLPACRQSLRDHETPFDERDGVITVGPQHANGVVIEFVLS
jgi:hypothetical protein